MEVSISKLLMVMVSTTLLNFLASPAIVAIKIIAVLKLRNLFFLPDFEYRRMSERKPSRRTCADKVGFLMLHTVGGDYNTPLY